MPSRWNVREETRLAREMRRIELLREADVNRTLTSPRRVLKVGVWKVGLESIITTKYACFYSRGGFDREDSHVVSDEYLSTRS